MKVKTEVIQAGELEVGDIMIDHHSYRGRYMKALVIKEGHTFFGRHPYIIVCWQRLRYEFCPLMYSKIYRYEKELVTRVIVQ